MATIPRDAEHDGDVDALYLAGQLPCDDGEWLLVTELDGLPGAAFTIRYLPRDAWHAHGGDVLVRLLPDTGSTGQPAVLAEVWAVMGGHLILAGTWNRQEPEEWPERIRPALAFTMGMLTELEEHDADLGARHRVRLENADTATMGVPQDTSISMIQLRSWWHPDAACHHSVHIAESRPSGLLTCRCEYDFVDHT